MVVGLEGGEFVVENSARALSAFRRSCTTATIRVAPWSSASGANGFWLGVVAAKTMPRG